MTRKCVRIVEIFTSVGEKINDSVLLFRFINYPFRILQFKISNTGRIISIAWEIVPKKFDIAIHGIRDTHYMSCATPKTIDYCFMEVATQ